MSGVAVVAGSFPRQPLAARVVEDDNRDVRRAMRPQRFALVRDDAFDLALEVEVERRHDARRRRAAALVRRRLGQGGNHLNEMRRAEAAGPGAQDQLFGARFAQPLGAQRAGRGHAAQHRLLPHASGRHVLQGIERTRTLGQRREERRLRRRQHGWIDAEVQLARAAGAGGLVAVRRQIQVHRQDFAFGETVLEAQRQHHFAHFHGGAAVVHPFPALDQELRDLLRNRRAPFDDASFAEVVPRRPQER